MDGAPWDGGRAPPTGLPLSQSPSASDLRPASERDRRDSDAVSVIDDARLAQLAAQRSLEQVAGSSERLAAHEGSTHSLHAVAGSAARRPLSGSADADRGEVTTDQILRSIVDDHAGHAPREGTAAAGGGEPAVFDPENPENSPDDIMDLDTLMPDAGAVAADPMLMRVYNAYSSLHHWYTTSRQNETALVKRCKELQEEVGGTNAKVQAALKLAQADRGTIMSFKKEVRKAWKLVESSAEKESRLKDQIQGLKNETEILKTIAAEKGVNDAEIKSRITHGRSYASAMPDTLMNRGKILEMNLEQEVQIKTLQEEKNNALTEQAVLKQQVSLNQSQIESLENRLEETSMARDAIEEELTQLKDLLSSKKSEADRELHVREKLDARVRALEEQLALRDLEAQTKASELQGYRVTIQTLETQMRDERLSAEKATKDRDGLLSRMTRLQAEYEEQLATATRLFSETQARDEELAEARRQTAQVHDQLKQVQRAKDATQKQCKQLEDARADLERQRDLLRGQIHGLRKTVEETKHTLDQTAAKAEALTREREVAQKNLARQQAATAKQIGLTKTGEHDRLTLEHEIKSYRDEAVKMRQLILTLETERERYTAEMSALERQIAERDEALKRRDNMDLDSRKRIQELDKKLKEQQAMYESVRADRNIYSRNLIERQDEVIEVQRKLKIMSHQIEQLKEEILMKEAALVKEQFVIGKVEKEKEGLHLQIGKLSNQLQKAHVTMANSETEHEKLRTVIQEQDHRSNQERKNFETIVHERDLLGTHLIHRNDEIALLQEKIKIQTSTLQKGEVQYRERLEDIRVLRLEIKRLRRERMILQTETHHVDQLRSMVFRLQKDLLKERTRVRVLEEELESPMNIHRWRKLAGSDPTTFELLAKVQTLQKRLISKTEQLIEKELMIAQKEKLYNEIKIVLARQPGPEVLEELGILKDAVKQKMRECKSLASEVNMYQAQSHEYAYTTERLTADLQELKRRYYDFRKKVQQSPAAQMARQSKEFQQIMARPPVTQYAGGGFALNPSHKSPAAATAATPAAQAHAPRGMAATASAYEDSDDRRHGPHHDHDAEPATSRPASAAPSASASHPPSASPSASESAAAASPSSGPASAASHRSKQYHAVGSTSSTAAASSAHPADIPRSMAPPAAAHTGLDQISEAQESMSSTPLRGFSAVGL